MREHPQGEALLRCAQSLLQDTLIPALPAELRHDALMLKRAMAIAQRQLQYGDAPLHAQRAALSQLLQQDFATLDAAEAALATALRQGAADPGAPLRDALLRELRASGRQRLLESNPRALEPDTRA